MAELLQNVEMQGKPCLTFERNIDKILISSGKSVNPDGFALFYKELFI